MPFSLRRFLAFAFMLTTIAMVADEPNVMAQAKKAAAPIAPSPQAPTITFPNPSGVQRGNTVELKFTGNNLADPIGVWASFNAKVTIPEDMNNGKEASKLRVQLEAPANAPIGVHSLRVVTKQGVSNAQVFCVDDLPQVAESETNHFKSTAQVLPIPCVVMGKIELESSDYFKVVVKAGQRLTFEVLGRRIGSALDPMILLHDAKTGRELPGLYSDDAPGLQSDARLTHTFKEPGEYFVELRDSTHRGGADFNYRLRIGEFPAALAPIPVALKRGAKATVRFSGSAVEGVVPLEITAPVEPDKSVIYAAPKFTTGNSGWPLPIALSDFDELAESEPNNSIASANPLPLPGGVTGVFQEKGDLDYYSFSAKKGVKFIIAAETYEINSPAEVYLILKNGQNAELAKSQPTAPTARIEYTATADEMLFIHAEHLNYAHGPNEVYHLTVKTAQPDVDVNIGIDRFEVFPGGTTLIPITGVVRRDYTGPVELSVHGPSGLSGSVTIPAGVPAAAPTPGQVIAYLPLNASGEMAMGAHEFRVKAKGTVNGKEFIRFANVTEIVKQAMAGLPFPPREMLTSLNVGITDKPLFALTAKTSEPKIVRGMTANLTIAATRRPAFVEEIVLTAVGLPANITVTLKPIPKGSNEVPIQILAAGGASPGPFTLYLRGSAKTSGKDFVYFATPISMTVEPEQKKEGR